MSLRDKLFNKDRILFWAFIIGIILAAMGFEEVYDDVFHDPLEGDYESQVFDRYLLNTFNELRTPHLTQIMTDITSLGSLSVLSALFITTVSILFVFKDLKGLVYQSLVAFGAAGWPFVLKLYFKRSRPEDFEHLALVTTYSFPSGHAFAATAIYISFFYYIAKLLPLIKQKLYFYLLGSFLILLVSASRVYLGVHYPTDVLAGISAGAVWVLLITAIFEYKEPQNINLKHMSLKD